MASDGQEEDICGYFDSLESCKPSSKEIKCLFICPFAHYLFQNGQTDWSETF